MLFVQNLIANDKKKYVEQPMNIREEGNLLKWDEIKDVREYDVIVNNESHKVFLNEFDLDTLEPGQCKIQVVAISLNGQEYNGKSQKIVIENKFRGLKIQAKKCDVTKVYDGGNEFFEAFVKGQHYELSNLKYGEDIDIKITNIKYNSADVKDCTKVIATYSAELTGKDAHNYKIKEGAFTLNASILPREVKIVPSKKSKQFSESDIIAEEIIYEDKTLNCVFSRIEGEEIGLYDLISASSNNSNYKIIFDLIDGKDKFEITKKYIEVVTCENIFISKTYNTSADYDETLLIKDVDYKISNVLTGYDVDIKILSAEFNSPNVSECSSLKVTYSAELIDENNVYQLVEGSFELPAKIAPKDIYAAPNNFVKQFGDADMLIQEIIDAENNVKINIVYARTEGEVVGKYDITAIDSSDNANYNVLLSSNSGIGKFEIIKRVINVRANKDINLQKTYDGLNNYIAEIKQDEHYFIDNLVDNVEARIKISNAVFNSQNVKLANIVTVYYEAELLLGGESYSLVRGSFEITGAIVAKKVEYEPEQFNKQFGDSDKLFSIYYDDELNSSINFTFVRSVGEYVGSYDILQADCDNSNYSMVIKNGENKFEISKRKIEIVSKNTSIKKDFDNNKSFVGNLTNGVHYEVINVLKDYPIDLVINNCEFNSKDIDANKLFAVYALLINQDKYELITAKIEFQASIKKKEITITPKEIRLQFGEMDNLSEQIIDVETGIVFFANYTREVGDIVGSYDILSATSSNDNFIITLAESSGVDKYVITPRKLNVVIASGISFNKKYDGTTDCGAQIEQGFHYSLDNLIGGTEVTLKIESQYYDSKFAGMANKVIVKYSARLNGIDGGNYETTEGYFEFPASITPKTLNITPYQFVKKYSESESLVQNYFDETTGETIAAYFTRDSGESVGKYNITSALSKNDNFVFKVVEGGNKFEIIKNEVIITAYDQTTQYNKLGQGINAPYATPNKELAVYYKLKNSRDSYSVIEPINAGIYSVKIEFAGDESYNTVFIEKTLIIERIESIITEITPKNYIYDGSIKKIIAQLNHNESVLSYSSNSFTNAGTYNNIMISAPQSTNYKASSIVVSLIIAKKVMTDADITFPTSSTIPYGDLLDSSTLNYTSPYGFFVWDNPLIKPNVNNNGYAVSFYPNDNFNYDWDNVTRNKIIQVTVNKAVASINDPTATALNYGQALKTSTLKFDNVYGTYSWDIPDVIPNQKVNYYNAIFTPYDTENFDWSGVQLTRNVRVEMCFPVNFETYGGNKVADMMALSIVTPPIPLKAGYIFEGWFLDGGFITAVQYPYVVDAPTTFHALWKVKGINFILQSDDTYSVEKDEKQMVINLIIPETYRGKKVTKILSRGFYGLSSIEQVFISRNIIEIGEEAFVGCANIKQIHVCRSKDGMTFGAYWNKVSASSVADTHFNCEKCSYCDGSDDFHINCNYCGFCDGTKDEHKKCKTCNSICTGDGSFKLCLKCGSCLKCIEVCPECQLCKTCKAEQGVKLCPKCHWCGACNDENGFEVCIECGECNSCETLCTTCNKCKEHCLCDLKVYKSILIDSKLLYSIVKTQGD